MSGSEAGRWERVEDLFHRTLGVSPREAASLLDEECADEPDVRHEVESLLESAGSAGGFFDSLSEHVFSLGADGEGSASAALRDVVDPFVGTRVRQYEILEPIGKGGMSHVYRGFDTVLQRGVALKFLPSVEPGSETHQRFFVEARATAALDHDNICNIYEIGESEDGRPFIAMTLYEGETLEARVSRGPVELDDVLGLALQACAGLARAHEVGIIHRDIKPGNLFITRDGSLKVLDFGLAKLTDVTLTGTGRTLGTLSYMSPEQALGERVDARTDVWSLGVVLYQMLAGERPFGGRNAAAIVTAIVRSDPPPLDARLRSVPRSLARVVMATLEKDRDRRTPSIRTLEAELRAVG